MCLYKPSFNLQAIYHLVFWGLNDDLSNSFPFPIPVDQPNLEICEIKNFKEIILWVISARFGGERKSETEIELGQGSRGKTIRENTKG